MKHPRCVITIEGSEEGEIDDLLYYLKTYRELLREPTLLVCLDAGGVHRDTLTLVNTLKGCMNFELSA